MFKLLDTTSDGLVDVDEFVDGLLQLKGPAKAVHLAKLHHDNCMVKREMEKMDQRIGSILAYVRNNPVPAWSNKSAGAARLAATFLNKGPGYRFAPVNVDL